MLDVKQDEILRSRENRIVNELAYDAWIFESPAYDRIYDATCIESPQGCNQAMTAEIRQQLSKAPLAMLEQEAVNMYTAE